MTSNGDLGTPITQWLQDIRFDLYNVLTIYKHVVVHRAKLACLCSELHSFHKNKGSQSNRSVTPPESEKLNQLRASIAKLREVFISYNTENHISTLISNPPDQILQDLSSFRNLFNKIIKEFGFMKTDPCNAMATQIRVDDISDCQAIVERIDSYIESKDLGSESEKQVLLQKRTEYNQLIESYNKQEEASRIQNDQKMRQLTPEEVENEMKQILPSFINYDDFEIQKTIGEGGFSVVYLAYHKEFGKLVALKKLKFQNFRNQDFRLYVREVKNLYSLKHFAIIPFVGCSYRFPYSIVTEFMSGGSLYERLRKQGIPLDGTKKTIIALGVAYAMQYMHMNQIIHRDLKSLNILLDSDDYPKICDFGMSRDISEPSLRTGSVGTYQWMAPEVLDSREYDNKVDVYSFGIVLWELFTQDVPYRGLSDFQIMIAVLQKDTRPLIPQNCPSNLTKLIRKCWEKEPKNRPDFSTLVTVFENGAVCFPGTNYDIVSSYINQSKIKNQELVQFDTAHPTKIIADSIIGELIPCLVQESKNDRQKVEAGALNALGKLQKICLDPKWQELLRDAKLTQTLIGLMRTCENSQISFEIIIVLDMIFGNYEMRQEFQDLGGPEVLLELILIFGSASMPKIIDVMSILIDISNIKLSAEHYSKIASFLGTPDYQLRVSSTQLLCKSIDQKSYINDSALIVIINSVLLNLVPESKTDLLISSLQLLALLTKLTKPKQSLSRSTEPEQLLSLLKTTNKNVINMCLDIIAEQINDIVINDQYFSSFAGVFTQMVDNDSEIQGKAITLFTQIIKLSGPNRHATKCIDGLKHCFKANEKKTVALSLFISYSLLNNPDTYPDFKSLDVSLVSILITTADSSIIRLAVSCLTIIVMHEKDNCANTVFTDSVADIITNTMFKNPEMSAFILRFAGMIACSFKGALFLKSKKIVQFLSKFLSSDSMDIKKLAFMVFASLSASLPHCASSDEVLSAIIGNLDAPDLSPYPLDCLSNIVLDSASAAKSISAINKVVTMFDIIEDDDIIMKALLTTQRVLSDPIAINSIKEDQVDMRYLCRVAIKLISSNKYNQLHLQILEMISTVKVGKEALIVNGFDKTAWELIEKLSNNDPKRPLLIRIVSRLENS